jgi:hypothetical protein
MKGNLCEGHYRNAAWGVQHEMFIEGGFALIAIKVTSIKDSNFIAGN